MKVDEAIGLTSFRVRKLEEWVQANTSENGKILIEHTTSGSDNPADIDLATISVITNRIDALEKATAAASPAAISTEIQDLVYALREDVEAFREDMNKHHIHFSNWSSKMSQYERQYQDIHGQCKNLAIVHDKALHNTNDRLKALEEWMHDQMRQQRAPPSQLPLSTLPTLPAPVPLDYVQQPFSLPPTQLPPPIALTSATDSSDFQPTMPPDFQPQAYTPALNLRMPPPQPLVGTNIDGLNIQNGRMQLEIS